MADITLCTNKLCPLADSCKRISAVPSDWQSYAFFNYVVTTDWIICEDYLIDYNFMTTTTDNTLK